MQQYFCSVEIDMDKCVEMSMMPWMQSTSIRQFKQMSRERGFAEIIAAFDILFIQSVCR